MTMRSGYELTKRQAIQYDKLAKQYGDYNIQVTGIVDLEAEISVHVTDDELNNLVDRLIYVDGYGRIVSEY